MESPDRGLHNQSPPDKGDLGGFQNTRHRQHYVDLALSHSARKDARRGAGNRKFPRAAKGGVGGIPPTNPPTQ